MLFTLVVFGLSSSPLGCDACRFAVDLVRPFIQGIGAIESELQRTCRLVADGSICDVLLRPSGIKAILSQTSGQVCTNMGICQRVSASTGRTSNVRLPKTLHPIERIDIPSLPISGDDNGAALCEACKLAVNILKPAAAWGGQMVDKLEPICNKILKADLCDKILNIVGKLSTETPEEICQLVKACQVNNFANYIPARNGPSFSDETQPRWTKSWREDVA